MTRTFLFILSAVLAGCVKSSEPPIVESVPIDVEGRIDHLAFDYDTSRLWLAALGNNTVEVLHMPTLNLTRKPAGTTQPAGLVEKHIRDIAKPQGIVAIPALHMVAVASGGDGKLRLFDSHSMNLLHEIAVGDDADNVRYDSAASRLYVGYGDGALAVIDPVTAKKLGDIKLAGHPESFQLETAGPRIFVNVPDAHEVAVIDRDKQAVVAHWKLEVGANFPMALDEINQRLIIVCRKPAKLVVLDTANGRMVASLDCSGDCDDVFYAPVARRIYASCGEGFIDVFAQLSADRYELVRKLPTAPGARTSTYLAKNRMVLLAVPHRVQQPSELRIYRME